jgi:type II secretory pathway component PulF
MNKTMRELFNVLQNVNFSELNKKQKFNKVRQVEFLKYFSTWLFTGSSPVKACNAIMDSVNDKRSALDAEAAAAIKDSLFKGAGIAEGMKKFFDPEIVMLFQVSQRADANALNRILAEYLKQEERIASVKKEFVSDIKYPSLILAVLILTIIIVGGFLIPGFNSILPGGVGTFGTIAVLLASFITTKFAFVLSVSGATYFVVRHLLTNFTRKWRKVLDGYFPFSMYRAVKGMKFLKLLGILIEHRTSARKAISSIAEQEVPYMRWHLDAMRTNLSSGKPLAKALDSGLFTNQTLNRVRLSLQVEDPEYNQKAVSLVADATGEDVLRSLNKTRLIIRAFAWGIVVLLAALVIGAFVDVAGSLQTLSNIN